MAGDPVIPPPLDDDDDDVAWALQTAAVQWNRGARADAVVWLRRAVDAAIASGNSQRTKDLTRLAAQVADSLVAVAMAQPDSAAPPAPSAAPVSSAHGSDFDHLLPNPRHSLTGEIPFEIESEGEDDFDDQAPTIPPPREDEALSGQGTHTSGEYSVAADDLLPESVAPEPRNYLEDLPRPERIDPDGSEHPGLAEPTLESPLDHRLRDSETPTVERDVDGLEETAAELAPITTEDAATSAPGEVMGTGSAPITTEDAAPPVFEPAAESAPITTEDAAPSVSDQAARAPVSVEPTGEALRPPPVSSSGPPSIEPTLEVPVPPEEEAAPAEASAPAESGPPVVDGVSLDGVRGFEDLPEDAQQRLAASATVTELSPDEEVLSFAAALVTAGRVGIMPAIADVAAGVAEKGDVVFTRGTLDEGVLLRVVAQKPGTRVASWSADALGAALADCPWVEDELRHVADRFQALAGAVLGPLGERLDDSLRGLVTPKLEVKAYGPGEVIVAQGKPVPGLHIVGAGRVEIVEGDVVKEDLSPGDFLFAAEVLAAGKAHATARAGAAGALLLVASRTVAHELLVSVPPLLEILAG